MDFDAELSRRLAATAGALLLGLREELGFADPGALKDAGDQAAHAYLMKELADWRPDDAVLSEEATGSREADDEAERLSADRVWIVDPLDGTREYAEEGRTDWAVHVALWSAAGPSGTVSRTGRRRRTSAKPVTGGKLVAASIALPAQGLVFSTEPAPGSIPSARGHRVTPEAGVGPDGAVLARGTRVRIAVSRTRPPAVVEAVAAELDALLVPMGSAGAKIAAVITGEVDAYVHAGGQYEWDSAAPVAVAAAVGLHTSRLDGSPLVYNQADPLLPDLLVCRRDLARPLLDALARALAPEPEALDPETSAEAQEAASLTPHEAALDVAEDAAHEAAAAEDAAHEAAAAEEAAHEAALDVAEDAAAEVGAAADVAADFPEEAPEEGPETPEAGDGTPPDADMSGTSQLG